MRIGELARRTGVSVRALHHYHEIGLLVPSHHAPGDHRVYTTSDLARLQQVLSLRALGLSLDEIAGVLDGGGDAALLDSIERHLARLDEELERGARLRDRLSRIASTLRSEATVEPELWLETIQESVMFEKYYTPEQLEQLRARHDEVGAERIAQVQHEWAALFREAAALEAAGADPHGAEGRALAERANALVEEFTGGDPGIRASLTKLYQSEGPQKVLGEHDMAPEPGAWAFLARAREPAS